MMLETNEARLKRLYMRSIRRGIKEMDLILGAFAAEQLSSLSDAELVLYDALLAENDHDLYQWVTGQVAIPSPYRALMGRISVHAGAQ